jgi:hypothetical protein
VFFGVSGGSGGVGEAGAAATGAELLGVSECVCVGAGG